MMVMQVVAVIAPMFRPDGYDTDSGLISSGRLRMTRTLPPRMAVIPETLVVMNNRSGIIIKFKYNVPTNLRNSAFLNEANTNTLRSRTEFIGGYETDSGYEYTTTKLYSTTSTC